MNSLLFAIIATCFLKSLYALTESYLDLELSETLLNSEPNNSEQIFYICQAFKVNFFILI